MIFVQSLFDNFCDKFLSRTHIMFLFALVFESILLFLCKIMVASKIVNQMVVQTTQLVRKRERETTVDRD